MTPGITDLRGPVAPLDPAALADREAAKDVARIYALSIDLRDEAMTLSLFDPDATITGALGTAPAKDYVPRLISGQEPHAATMHAIHNQYVTIDGDKATVWSYCKAYHVFKDKTRPTMIANSVLKDEMKRTPKGWIITARHADHKWRDNP